MENPRKIISTSGRDLVLHPLKLGEDFDKVAEKYSVRPSDIRIWNNIPYGKPAGLGDTISVWLTPGKYKLFSSKQTSLLQNKGS